jgi:hypothetical protein
VHFLFLSKGEIAQLKAENARLGADNHGLRESNNSLNASLYGANIEVQRLGAEVQSLTAEHTDTLRPSAQRWVDRERGSVNPLAPTIFLADIW